MWPRKYYNQLVATACTLARKAYNCHCGGQVNHKTVFQDAPTLTIMEHIKNNITHRMYECASTKEKHLHELITNSSSFFSKMYEL